MRARLHRTLLVHASAIILLASVILVSGCILFGDGSGPATLTPSSSSAAPAPAGLYVDPPMPNATGTGAVLSPAMQKPPARVPYVDPAYGTRLVRATDCGADIAPGDASQGLKDDVPWAQAFNADGSLFLVRGTGGSWYLYDTTTLLPKGRLPFDGQVEPRWDATKPDVLYYADGARFMRYNITVQERAVVHDFSGEFPPHAPVHVWMYGGSPSADGRSWGLMAQGGMGKTFAFLIYDPIADQIVARRDITPTGDVESVSISPLGDYFLAYFNPVSDGRSGTDASPGGLMVYDRDLKNGRCLVPNVGDRPDLTVDALGREVLVYLDRGNHTLAMCDLATGGITAFFPFDSGRALQISGQALGTPGWALVSTGDRVFAVELKQGGHAFGLAWPNSLAAPGTTVDRNFTRVLFTSSWGRSDTGAVDTYMIVLPQGWVYHLP
jgi:hypothetical protein